MPQNDVVSVEIRFLLLRLLAEISLRIPWDLHSHPGKFWGNHAQTWQQLVKWQVVTTGFAPPALLEEFARSRDFIQASAIIGIGLAFSLEAIGNVIVPWVVTGTFTMVNGQVFIAEVYLSYLLGYGLGYCYGVWRLRRLTAGTSTYADLQRRALSQYRLPSSRGALPSFVW